MKSLNTRSWFGYNIQRDYDLGWFTPVTVVGGLFGIVFFSLINLASNGYDLNLMYTSDPNSVLADKPWYLSWSWDKHLQPNCSDQNIPVGAQVFTTNYGFTYTLRSVRSADTTDPSNLGETGSVPYLAQPLENCTVENVNMVLYKADQSSPGLNTSWWSWDSSYAQATAHCTVATHGGPHNVQLMVEYKPTASMFDYVIQSNYTESSSMWWATRLLNLYWYSTLVALSQQQQRFEASGSTAAPAWTKGGITYRPSGVTDDITRANFFNASFFFLASNGFLTNQDIAQVSDSSLLFNNASGYVYSESLTEGLSFARVMHSALLVDLGSNSSQNVLLNEALLRWILLHPDDTFRNDPKNVLNATRRCQGSDVPPGCYEHYGLVSVIASPNITHVPQAGDLDDRTKSQLMNVSFDAYQPLMGPLKARSKVFIFSQYACQVPRKKPFGTVILPLLVADLVFIQACWKILNLVAVKWIQRKDKDRTAMWCAGCLKWNADSLSQLPDEVQMDRIQGKRTRPSTHRVSHGTNGSYLSLGSDGSGDTARHSERDDIAWHKHRTDNAET